MIPESSPAPSIGAVACTKVLIADDEPNIVVSLEFMMKREGFDVLVARDGRQALDAIRREHPRLVLLDATMPGMSGFDVCEAVRADADVRSTLIVMLTAKGRETDMARGVGAGADAYVTKPFSTRDLVQQVKDMLAKDTAARELATASAAASEMPKDLPA
ncbi:response regulator transcription factor [Xanthobacter autotrophicus]|uniref:response regulator transcription factor n=1 Tax=Xanthobacter autotrophicus TaxID=280 RepID=UPI00372C724D